MYQFVEVMPEQEDADAAWVASFDVGRHIYELRIERIVVDEFNRPSIEREQNIIVCRNGWIHFTKFDNALNSFDPANAFKPLEKEGMLTVGEVKYLGVCLRDHISAFCVEHRPRTLIGVPNREKLERWYRRMASEASVRGYWIRNANSAYWERSVLLMHAEDGYGCQC